MNSLGYVALFEACATVPFRKPRVVCEAGVGLNFSPMSARMRLKGWFASTPYRLAWK